MAQMTDAQWRDVLATAIGLADDRTVPVAVLQCSVTMRSRLIEDIEDLRVRTFAFPAGEWRPRRWHLAVFVSQGMERDERQIVALGLVHPGRRITTYERSISIERVRAVVPGLPVSDVRGVLRRQDDLIERNGPLTQAQGRTILIGILAVRTDLLTAVRDLVDALSVAVATGPVGEIRAWEKDATGVLLDVAGIDRDVLRDWRPGPVVVPFLSGLPPASRTEEATLLDHDAGRFGDWMAGDTTEVGWRVFSQGEQRIFIYNANAKAVEHALGVDLVYYHEPSGGFVLLQYKKMRRSSDNQQWGYRPDARLKSELTRMRAVDDVCRQDSSADNLRLVPTPCLVKLCEAQTIIADSSELIAGMYLTREHFEYVLASQQARGPRQGVVIGYHNVPRHMSNTTFTQLVGDGWIGSRGTGSEYVLSQIEASRQAGQAVVVGRHTTPNRLGNSHRRR
jgi:hypothetical protein